MTDDDILKELNQKDLEDLNNFCEECKKEDKSVSQNLILTGFKICESCRISNVKGKNAVGVELPNQERESVNLKEIFGLKDFDISNSKLPLVFGKDIGRDKTDLTAR